MHTSCDSLIHISTNFTGIVCDIKRHTKLFSEKANLSELFNAASEQLNNLKGLSDVNGGRGVWEKGKIASKHFYEKDWNYRTNSEKFIKGTKKLSKSLKRFLKKFRGKLEKLKEFNVNWNSRNTLFNFYYLNFYSNLII